MRFIVGFLGCAYALLLHSMPRLCYVALFGLHRRLISLISVLIKSTSADRNLLYRADTGLLVNNSPRKRLTTDLKRQRPAKQLRSCFSMHI